MHIYFLMFALVSIALAGRACQQNSTGSTVVIRNVKGYTLAENELLSFNSIAFREGKVLGVSADGFPETVDTSGATVIDGEGHVLLPGLIDAHGHVMGLGYKSLDADVAGAESLDEALRRIRTYAEEYTESAWIRGRGWNHTHWGINRFPTASELDKAVHSRPVWLTRVDGHAGWANSKAMEVAGITKETEDPADGKIIRDAKGNPTGIFVDGAMQLIGKHLPDRTAGESREALKQALLQMNAHGLTSVHDAGIDADTWALYKEFADEEKMTVRIYAMIGGTGSVFDTLSESGPVRSYANDRLALRSVKLYADGALGSRGAAMLHPYSDDPENKGLLFYSQEELTGMIMKAASRGYQTNVHAIGDRANRVVLDAFEQVKDSLGGQELRHRIEHAQIVAPEEIPRFKELDIIASMQPTHATSDMNMAEDRIGPERISGGYAWRRFLDQGTVIAGGSDFPVEHVNPFYGLYSAITRQNHAGEPEGGWYPGQRMTKVEAFRAFTADAAYAAGQESILGTLEPGKWADFILIDRDIFYVPARELWQTEVLETWVAGEKVYEAGK